MTRKTTCCGICENSNLPSICTLCVNYSLNEYSTVLKSLKGKREALCGQLSEILLAKGKANDQLSWRVPRNEKLARLREKLQQQKEQISQGRAKIEKVSHDLKVQYELLGSATRMMAITSELLHKQSLLVKQICKLFPQRCERQKLELTAVHLPLVHLVSIWVELCYDSGKNLDCVCLVMFPLGITMAPRKKEVTVDGDKKDGSSGQYDSICNARLLGGLVSINARCTYGFVIL